MKHLVATLSLLLFASTCRIINLNAMLIIPPKLFFLLLKEYRSLPTEFLDHDYSFSEFFKPRLITDGLTMDFQRLSVMLHFFFSIRSLCKYINAEEL